MKGKEQQFFCASPEDLGDANILLFSLSYSENLHRLRGTSAHHLEQLPAKAGSLGWVTQESIQLGFDYLQRRRLHLSVQLISAFCHPQSKALSCVQVDFPVLQLKPIAPHPATGHQWKEHGPIHLIPAHLQAL